MGGTERPEAVRVHSDGKIVVAGSTDQFGSKDWGVIRVNADGTLDTSFSTDGKDFLPFTSQNDIPHDIAIMPDGKIIVAGGFQLTRPDDLPSNKKSGAEPELIVPGNEPKPIPNIQPPVPLPPKRTGN